MRVIFKPQAEKYLKKVPSDIREKLLKGVEDIKNGSDKVIRIRKNEFRYKNPPYRILFTLDKENQIIYITEINTRGDIKYKEK